MKSEEGISVFIDSIEAVIYKKLKVIIYLKCGKELELNFDSEESRDDYIRKVNKNSERVNIQTIC